MQQKLPSNKLKCLFVCASVHLYVCAVCLFVQTSIYIYICCICVCAVLYMQAYLWKIAPTASTETATHLLDNLTKLSAQKYKSSALIF